MINLYQYIFESSNPTSDEAILYKIGKYKFNSRRNSLSDETLKKYDINKDNPRSGIIRWMKDVTAKLLPDNEEIIHRKYWDLDSLNGETEKQLMHLDYWTISQYIIQNHKRKHDVLTIFECSNAKPYASNRIIKNVYLDKYGAFTDFACMSNPGVIPMEFSHFYPYRYDEWDHGAENDDIADKYCKINKYRFINYVKALGYKHVIIVMQNPHTQICFDSAYNENINNCQSWMHIVTNDEFRKKIEKKYASKFDYNKGLMIQRTMLFPLVRERYERTLKSCLKAEDKKNFTKLLTLIKDDDKDGIKEFNKELGWNPINYETGIKNANFERLTGKDSVDESKVNKYKKFVEGEIEDIINKAKEPEDGFYKGCIYNTTLDWLLKYYKDKSIDDPDTEYWNMYAALNSIEGLECFCDYCFCIKDLCDKFKIKMSKIKEEANDLKLIQLKLKQQKAKV